MATYIALLRGINVGGHKLISMPALRLALAELRFTAISTYIQSGNIIFNTDIARTELAQMITDTIQRHFNHHVAVIITTPSELRKVITGNPFAAQTLSDNKQPYVYFGSVTPDASAVELLKSIDFQNDRFAIDGANIYVYYHNGAGATKLTSAVIEKKLAITVTARNWKTVNQLLAMAE